MNCKRCNKDKAIKNGIVRARQRWLCKECGFNFVQGDQRGLWREIRYQRQKALAILLVGLGLSYRAAGKVVGVVRNTAYQWFKRFAEKIELPSLQGSLEVVEMDEKRQSSGFGKPQRLLLVQLDSLMSKWAVAQVEL